MKINRQLLWDYSFNEKEMETESFKDWYVVRVLARGGMEDIRGIGLQDIHDRFPRLFLPPKIDFFWRWYFSLPEIEKQYGHLDAPPKRIHP